jgi:hypothetical protein
MEQYDAEIAMREAELEMAEAMATKARLAAEDEYD